MSKCLKTPPESTWLTERMYKFTTLTGSDLGFGWCSTRAPLFGGASPKYWRIDFCSPLKGPPTAIRCPGPMSVALRRIPLRQRAPRGTRKPTSRTGEQWPGGGSWLSEAPASPGSRPCWSGRDCPPPRYRPCLSGGGKQSLRERGYLQLPL